MVDFPKFNEMQNMFKDKNTKPTKSQLTIDKKTLIALVNNEHGCSGYLKQEEQRTSVQRKEWWPLKNKK
jgi:hypothetical protein